MRELIEDIVLREIRSHVEPISYNLVIDKLELSFGPLVEEGFIDSVVTDMLLEQKIESYHDEEMMLTPSINTW